VADRVPLPNLPPDEEVNTEVPETDEVEGIRSYFRQFEYASRRHVEFELIAEIGLRMGAIRAIDLEDFDPEDLVIHLRHRPEATEDFGTPLKNGPTASGSATSRRSYGSSGSTTSSTIATTSSTSTAARPYLPRRPVGSPRRRSAGTTTR